MSGSADDRTIAVTVAETVRDPVARVAAILSSDVAIVHEVTQSIDRPLPGLERFVQVQVSAADLAAAIARLEESPDVESAIPAPEAEF